MSGLTLAIFAIYRELLNSEVFLFERDREQMVLRCAAMDVLGRVVAFEDPDMYRWSVIFGVIDFDGLHWKTPLRLEEDQLNDDDGVGIGRASLSRKKNRRLFLLKTHLSVCLGKGR